MTYNSVFVLMGAGRRNEKFACIWLIVDSHMSSSPRSHVRKQFLTIFSAFLVCAESAVLQVNGCNVMFHDVDLFRWLAFNACVTWSFIITLGHQTCRGSGYD